MSHMEKISAAFSFWEKLKQVKRFTRAAQSQIQEEKGWNRQGCGEVLLSQPDENVIVFYEKGYWLSEKDNKIAFSNTFRWTLDQNRSLISLEHLRFGSDRPVFLFQLIPSGDHCLSSACPHSCGEDIYLAIASWSADAVHVRWQITGPKKNEQIECFYFFS